MADEIARLGLEVDSTGVEKAKVSLDELAKSGQAAENAARGVGESWSSVGQKAGNASGQIDKAAGAFKQGNDALRQQQQELGKLLGSIDPVIAALDRLDKQEEKLRGFRAAGAIDQETFAQFQSTITRNREALGGFSESLDKAGVSAGQTRAALRQLPAQFSDIFISLQAGQSPLSVFLQQGAQIKDSFGGVGAALRETGKFALGLVNPFTVAAAAALALATAYQQGSQEAVEFNKSLILTGNAAGTTAAELGKTAEAIDGVIGTQAKAAEVLAQLAATGKIGAEQFELLATAAISFEDATGQAVAKSIEAYVKLGEAPVETLLKLNEGTNFLTEAQLESVIAFQRQGNAAEAARVAQEAYARSQIERSAEVIESLGLLETGWNAVARGAKEAWDEMLNIGRTDDTSQLKRLQSQLEEIQNSRSLGGALLNPVDFGASFTGAEDAIQKQIQAIKDRQQAEKDAAAAEGVATAERNKRLKETAEADKKRTEAEKEFSQIVQSNLTKEQKLAAEVAKIRATGATAKVDQSEIDRQVAAAEDAFARSIKTRKPRAEPAVRDDAATRILLGLREQESALNLQLSTNEKLTRAEQERAKFIQQIADLQTKEVLTAEQKSLLAGQDAIKAQLDKNVAIEKEIQLRDDTNKLIERGAQLQATADAANQGRRDQAEALLGTAGLGKQEREIVESFSRIRKEYNRYREELDKATPEDQLGSDTYKDQVAKIDASLQEALEIQRKYFDELKKLQADAAVGAKESLADYVTAAQDLAGQTKGLTDNILRGVEDSFVSLATTGKASFKDLANSIIEDIVRIGTRSLISNAIIGAGFGGAGAQQQGIDFGQIAGSIAGLFAGGGGGSAGYTGAFGFEGGGFTGQGQRAGGVDGRGGFMAVLHPNETVIDHMKAGSGNTWTGGQSSNAVTIGNIVLPGVTNEREGRRAAATVGREINRVVAGSARYA